MIKIFLTNGKMNAVDLNNNLVGFDTTDDCCAHGGWFVSLEKISKDLGGGAYDQTEAIEYQDYSFDPSFFEDDVVDNDSDNRLVRFRMVAEGKPDLFLHLYNCHNGYYSKGFESSFGEIKHEGYL